MTTSTLSSRTTVLGAVMFLFASLAVAAQERLYLADKYIWGPPDGVRAVRISGKFNSRELMVAKLKLDLVVGTVPDARSPTRERVLTLGDILVSMDLNANGYVGSWTIAGPRSVVTAYVSSLSRTNDDRSVFYDFGVTDLVPSFSTD
jgi:hypothetical protein